MAFARALLLTCAVSVLDAAVQPLPLSQRPWLAPGQPIAQRVASLIATMTLEEKAAQLAADCSSSLNYTLESWASTSFGTLGIECSAYANEGAVDMAGRIAIARQYQLDALRISRLGIPITFHTETSHSGAAGGTIFPMGITLGASFDADLVGDVFGVIGVEARAWGATRGLSPEINVATDPRFGRSEENFGSDPLLVSKLAERATIGLQGGIAAADDYLPGLAAGASTVAAEAKHCLAYGWSGLDGGAADIDEKTLHDVYFKPWRVFVRAGGRGAMTAHNNLNSVPMHANAGIMTTLFRGTWGFRCVEILVQRPSISAHTHWRVYAASARARNRSQRAHCMRRITVSGLPQSFSSPSCSIFLVPTLFVPTLFNLSRPHPAQSSSSPPYSIPHAEDFSGATITT